MNETPQRKPKPCDRLCDLCNQPMIGIMRVSCEHTPRKVCDPCGGRAIHDA